MIDFKATLESVQEITPCVNLFEDLDKQTQRKRNHEGARIIQSSTSTEYLLSLEAVHNFDGDSSCNRAQNAEIIVVVDNSTSMRGTPSKQVQSALIKVLDITRNVTNCRVILYNQFATEIKLTGIKDLDESTINSITVRGGTSFVEAFKELGKIFEQRGPMVHGGPRSNQSIATPQQSDAVHDQRQDEQAYLDKVKQLGKYIEPLRRVIERIGIEHQEQLGMMNTIMDILSNPTKRIPMEKLLKCEAILEKIFIGATSQRTTSERYDQQQNANPLSPHYIFFMTDGQDTLNDPRKIMDEMEHLQEMIEKFGGEVVFNVLGFSSHHAAKFLDNLSLIGTSDGSYSFVSPFEGEKALSDRLVALVQSTTNTIGRTVHVEATSNNIEFLSDWFGMSEKKVILPAKINKTQDGWKILTKKFIRIPNDEEPHIVLNLYEELRGRTKPIEARVVEWQKSILNDKSGVTTHNLKKLRAAMNMITYRMRISEVADDLAVRAAYEFVKNQMCAIKETDTANSHAKRYHATVTGQLGFCSPSLEPGSRNNVEAAMSSRGAMSASSVSSDQPQNLCVSSPPERLTPTCSTGEPRAMSPPPQSTRTPLQNSVRLTDYSGHSDAED
jgi:hypothetical protein